MEIIIDGNKINTLDDFYNQIEQFLLRGNCPWGRNLDSLDEIVHCLFNYTEDKTLNVKKIVWLNSERSKNILGKEETIKDWVSKKGESPYLSEEKINEKIKELEDGRGETLFEKLAQILQRSGKILVLFTSTKEDGARFNKLEKALLEWFTKKYKDPAFISQIKSAAFKKREANNAGFYIEFEVSPHLPSIDFSYFTSKTFPIDGPYIVSKDIEHEAGAILWGRDGHVDNIEIYGSGHFFKEFIEDFELHDTADSEEFRLAMEAKKAKKK